MLPTCCTATSGCSKAPVCVYVHVCVCVCVLRYFPSSCLQSLQSALVSLPHTRQLVQTHIIKTISRCITRLFFCLRACVYTLVCVCVCVCVCFCSDQQKGMHMWTYKSKRLMRSRQFSCLLSAHYEWSLLFKISFKTLNTKSIFLGGYKLYELWLYFTWFWS